MSGLAGLAGPIGLPGAQGALLYVDANTRDVYVRGRPVALTPKEAALLTVLYERRGSTVGYGTICERVWGWAYSEESATNIHNLVSRLRRKVEAGPGRPALLERRDGGYLLRTIAAEGPTLLRRGLLLGREEERAALRDLLLPGEHEAPWLVTLVGAPGVGKTSLALQVAEDLRESFGAGSAVVPLEALTEPRLLVTAIAQRLKVRDAPGRSLMDGLKAHLRDRQHLLVLDNFEQLTEAAPVLAELSAECPRLKLLVTSRVALRLRGEQEYLVRPLALPRSGPGASPATVVASPAGALFVSRARAVAPDFALTEQNAAAVAEICNRLEGLPLSIELAAARVRVLPPAALAGRLQRRLAVLTGGARDMPRRHQTLQAALTWSHDLLDPAERVLFRRLAVFAGGFDLAAAEAVDVSAGGAGGAGVAGDAGDTAEAGHLSALDSLAGLESLVAQSLLRQESEPSLAALPGPGEGLRPAPLSESLARLGWGPRFRMLETLREFALERLEESGEAASVRDRHADHYLALAEVAALGLRGPQQAEWLHRLDPEHDNFRTALVWLLERRDATRGLRLGGALWHYWLVREHLTEGRRWLRELLALPVEAGTEAARARARATAGSGLLAWYQRDEGSDQALLEEALAAARAEGEGWSEALALLGLGQVAAFRSDFARAAGHYEASRERFAALGEGWGLAWALVSLGRTRQALSALDEARSLYEEALAVARRGADDWGIAHALHLLAEVGAETGDLAVAHARAEESLAVERRLGRRDGAAWSLETLGRIAVQEGKLPQARALYEEDLALRRDEGSDQGVAGALVRCARVAREMGERDVARDRLDEALRIYRERGPLRLVPVALLELELLARQEGDLDAARGFLVESLDIHRRLGNKAGLASTLEQCAGLAAARGRPEEALRLLGASQSLREEIGVARASWRQPPIEAGLAPARRALPARAQAAALAAGRALSPEEAIGAALAALGAPPAGNG